MTRSRICIAVVLLAACGAAHTAVAQDADAMIARGLELRREGKPEQALEMFQRAHAVAPSPRTLGQMGIVEGTLEHWTEAETHLTAALAAPTDPWVKKQQALLQSALESVKTHIGQIVFAGTAGAAVTVAGISVGTLPTIAPVRVAAGTVLVTASSPNAKQFVERVEVQAGMQTAVRINLQPIDVIPVTVNKPASPPQSAAPPLAPPIPVLQPHYTWKTWLGGALLVAGTTAAIWGITWIVVDGKKTDGMCTSTSQANCSTVFDTKTAGWVLTGTGVAAAAAGGFLIYSAQAGGTDVSVSFSPRSITLGGHF